MTERLAGKCVLVTGAAQGIGRAIVERFVAEGATVVACDIRTDGLADLPQQAIATKLDVTSAANIQEVIDQHPRIDVLVNCAGHVAVGTALECDAAEFAHSLRVNIESVYLLSAAVLPGMRARRDGVIINIASVVSTTMAARRRFVYSATKGAVLAMTRSIAFDFVADGIRCNSISPGSIDSPSLGERIARAPDPAQARRELLARQPMGRLGKPTEIAAVAVTLASAESSFMTGADIVIDGGISL